MIEITMIRVVFFIVDSFCLCKTQFQEQTFLMSSNWQITGAYSENKICDCPGGGYGIFGGGSVIYGSYSNIPYHTEIKVQNKSLLYWFIGFGDSFNQQLYVQQFSVAFFWKPFKGVILQIHYKLLQIQIQMSLNEALGVTDVLIYIKTTQCVQFYSECNYTGIVKELSQGSPNLQRKN
ncbi:unnamed protein product [Paramecium sonneborni]|uniref:Transmembrane protein n=1 Tax=Paramecium sonneborni TaxID=65129 RepID=A0A8S1QL20_9CILI|nr:unnamed protein product [Paramecium sonneborni]